MANVTDLLTTPADGNLAWQGVKILFGDGSTPWARAVQSLSTALMLLASGMLAWHVVSGIVASAYTGRVLGERWNRIWAPVRVVIGMALLVPLPPSGLSSAHYLVKQAAVVSINLADRAWSTFVTTVAEGGHALSPTSATGSRIVLWALESEVCYRVAATSPVAAMYQEKFDPPSVEGKTSGNFVRWTWGTECGSLTIGMPESKAGFADARRTAIAKIVGELRDRSQIAIKFAEHYAASGTASGIANESHGDVLVANSVLPNKIAEYVKSAGAEYDATIGRAATAEASARDVEARRTLAAGAEGQGWAAAGMYWRSLSQISLLTSSLAAEAPERIAPRPGAWGVERDRIADAMNMLQARMRAESVTSVSADDLAFAGDAEADILARTLAPLTRPIAEWATGGNRSDDPVGRMIAFGHALLTGAEAAIAAGAAVAVAGSNAISGALGGGGAVEWLLSWSKVIIGIVMIVGIVHAYVLPMIPFIFVVFLAIGWIVSIIEAMIAVPVWAMMWVRMDGDELIDRVQQPGAALLFNLILRPVIGILALCAGYYLVPLALNYVNSLWGTAFAGAQGGHVIGVVGMLAGIVLLTFVQWRVLIWVFGLIVSLPDRVARWFGAPTTGWDEGHAGQSVIAGAVAIGQAGNAARPLAGTGRSLPGKDDAAGGRDSAATEPRGVRSI